MAVAKEDFSDDKVFRSVSNTDISMLKPSVSESNRKYVSESNSKCNYRVTSAITKKENKTGIKMTSLVPLKMIWLQKNSSMQSGQELTKQ